MLGTTLFASPERLVLEEVLGQVGSVDREAASSPSARLSRIVDAFERAGGCEIRIETPSHLTELSIGVHLDVVDSEGNRLPELRLLRRRRSRIAIVRAARALVGALPPARLLVLTPLGYRLTSLKNLEARRFLANGRPRLARYKPSSLANLSKYLDAFEQGLGP